MQLISIADQSKAHLQFRKLFALIYVLILRTLFILIYELFIYLQ